jgi:Lrp/AsnC family transcriptional regulator, leucine-responsive regulatory protein
MHTSMNSGQCGLEHQVKSAYFGLMRAPARKNRKVQPPKLAKSANFELSDSDRHILKALQEDGRMTLQAIADRVGLSASPCLRRIRRMENAGVISAYSATVDQKAVGLPVSVFVSIKLERQRSTELDRFGDAIANWPEVMECYLMTGQFDYLLRVVCADLGAYEAFLREKLTQVDGVASIESSFALGQVKYSRVLPI